MPDNKPVACDLTAIAGDERKHHKMNSEELFTAIKEWKELSDGYAFRIPTETDMIGKAATFIARDRQCCPFFEFNLEVTPDNGPIWLKMSGNIHVKAFIVQNIIPQLNLDSEER